MVRNRRCQPGFRRSARRAAGGARKREQTARKRGQMNQRKTEGTNDGAQTSPDGGPPLAPSPVDVFCQCLGLD